MSIVTVGLDLAKHAFQVHGVDEHGRVVVRRQLRRDGVEDFFAALAPCLIGMEACATAHHWARRLAALGHRVQLIPPSRDKAYVQRGKKNDATDAAAIAEAVTRPHMAFVPVKTEGQQAVLMLHRTRDLLVRQRTMLINALRAHLAEFGIIAAQGRAKAGDLVAGLGDAAIPELARTALQEIAAQIEACDQRILIMEKEIFAWHKTNEPSRNLATIPGIGPITASRLAATVTDPSAFKNGRQLAAWLGVVPRQNSSGARTGWEESPRRVTIRSAACWSSAPPASSAAHAPGRRAMPSGSRRCSLANRRGSPPWRSPTRWRASPGPCWQGAKSTARPFPCRRQAEQIKAGSARTRWGLEAPDPGT